MAIVKMKRLRLIGLLPDRDGLLRQLQHLGCVELSEPAAEPEDPVWSQLARPEGRGLALAAERHSTLNSALEVLKKYAPAKGGLLTARPTLTEGELFDDGVYANGLAAADELLGGQREIETLKAQRAKLELQKAALAPWLALDVPLELDSDGTVSMIFGTVPARTEFAALEGELQSVSDLCQTFYAGKSQGLHCFLLVCHASAEEDLLAALQPYGFNRVSMKGWTGTAVDNDRRLDGELAALDAKLAQAAERLAAYAGRREILQRSADRAAQDMAREEAAGRLMDTERTFFLTGWVPESAEAGLAGLLGNYTCAWETEVPPEEDYPRVPVKLKNNRLTQPLNMVTEMYSLPAYNTVDPNPLMAPVFFLFYGIMMADLGYGLLMILASLIVTNKAKPRGAAGNMFRLAGLCGVTTFLFGALTGGFFGDFIPQLAKLINPASTLELPALFTPLNDTLMILVGSMALGFVHIVTGMAIGFIQKVKHGQIVDGIFEEVTWWIVFAGIALMVLKATNLVLYVGLALVVIGPLVTGKGFGKITGIFGSLYNHVTGFFGDILSYSRLMALMLAGSVIAQVFNTLGAIPGNIVVFVIISLAGNALNFALNLLGCYVHDLRLQCLEYFGKFYEDGGRPFQPLRIYAQHYDIKE